MPKLQSALSYCEPSKDENDVCTFVDQTSPQFEKLTDDAVSIKFNNVLLFILFYFLHFIDIL